MREEKKILEAISKNNHRSFLNETYKKMYPKIKGYILKNSGNLEDARDIFQDAILIFYKKLKLNDLDIKTNFESYIFTIAKNLWINKAKRDKRIHYSDAVIDGHDSNPDSLHKLISKERENTINNIFNQLGEKCATILRYIIYQDYSLAEVTELMNLSSAEVAHTTHYRCKKKLSSLVKGNTSFLKLLKSGNHE